MAGGDPTAAATTPFAVRMGFTLQDDPSPLLASGSRSRARRGLNAAELPPRKIEIPIALVASSADNVSALKAQLATALATASFSAPAAYKHTREGASKSAYGEIYAADIAWEPSSQETGIGVETGGLDVDGTLTILRSALVGESSLTTLINAVTMTNGTAQSFGTVLGELQTYGTPLNISFAKPASSIATRLYLASCYSAGAAAVASGGAVSTTSAAGVSASFSANIDVSALRTREGLKLRLFAKLSSLTAPASARIRAGIWAATGHSKALWNPPWTAIGTDTSSQLIDLGGTDLDPIRTPLSGTGNIKIEGSLQSMDGTTVGVTFDSYLVVLYYDLCVVESTSGQGITVSGEHYTLLGAQNLSGGGWLPLPVAWCGVTDSAGNLIEGLRLIQPPLVRAFAGASLFLAWTHAGSGYSPSDTAVVTAQQATLWRSMV